VAAGLVPVAHASDGAGSIRIPASWCGLIGLKPSRDRVVSRHAGQRRPEVEFVVARSLRDTARLLDELRPARARDEEPFRFSRSIARPPRRLRIGFRLQSPLGTPVDASCSAAVARAVAELERLGHATAEDSPAALLDYGDRALFGGVLGVLGYRQCLEELEERLGRPVDAHDVEPFLWELARDPESMGASAGEVERAIEWTWAWERSLLGWFDDYDLLVTPTVSEPAPPLSSLDPEHLSPLELLGRMAPHMAFTEPWNATGQPAISLPLGWSPEGLPAGVQLVARVGCEDDLLAVSAQLLQALGEPELRPGLHA
jgi:amidase